MERKMVRKMVRKMKAFVLIVVGALGLILGLTVITSIKTALLIVGVLAILGLIFLAVSIKTVRGDQRVLPLRFGKPKEVKDSGLRFCWKWIDKWIIYPTKEHCLSYDPIRMFTKKEKWGGPDLAKYEKYLAETERIKKEIGELEEKKELSPEEKNILAELKKEHQKMSKEEEEERKKYKQNAEEYDAAEIPVGATLYFWWPDKDLKEAFQFGPSPGDPEDPKYIEKLKKEFEDVIMGSLREIVGDMTWGEVISRREQIAKRLKERLMESGSPFDRAKIKNFYVVISEVDLPEDLKKLLTRRQEEKLKAEAAEQTAQRLNLEIGAGIGRSAKTLQEIYNFPQEKAQDAAIERHGDILAAREGELKRIHWMTKSSGGNNGCTTGRINPEVIAQAVVVAQEMLEMGKRPPEEKPETKKEEEEKEEARRKVDIRPERSFEVAKELATKREKREEEEKKKKEKRK